MTKTKLYTITYRDYLYGRNQDITKNVIVESDNDQNIICRDAVTGNMMVISKWRIKEKRSLGLDSDKALV